MAAPTAAHRGFTAMLLLLALSAPVLGAKSPPAAACNSTAYNCIPSCKKPCVSAQCLYQCHYDTMRAVLNLVITAPRGASIAAFAAAVRKLGLYLDDDVFLRIDPVGSYQGTDEVADYIATFQHPLGLGSVVSVQSVDVTHYANTGQVAAATVNLAYFLNSDPTRRITNLTIVTFSRFDSVSQKLEDGDWSFLRFPQFQTEINKPGPRVSDEASANMIQSVCAVDRDVCKPLGYPGYDNITDCRAFMASIPRVALYGLQGNNQFCRFLHVAYATVHPKVHCPHLSRSGGGMCVDQIYNDYYTVFPTSPFIGSPVI